MPELRTGFEDLGIDIRREDRNVVTELRYPPAGISGGAPGGIISLLVDLAGSGAVAALSGNLVSTISLSCTFNTSAIGRLRACGTTTHLGKTIGTATVIVTDDMTNVVAQGLVTVRLHARNIHEALAERSGTAQ